MDVNLYIDGDNSFGLDAGLVNVATDATLSIPGVAADAAATGDKKADVIITSASGSIASFPDGGNNMLVENLKINILPTQSGSGDPSPSNIRAISGWTGANVTRAGKNLLKVKYPGRTNNGITYTTNADGTISVSGTATGSSYFAQNYGFATQYMILLPAGTYTLHSDASSGNIRLYGGLYDVFGNNIGSVTQDAGSGTTFTLTDYTWFSFQIYVANGTSVNTTVKPMLEIGSTATAYEPYSGTTLPISWQTEAGTVYGGTLDVNSGALTVTWGSALGSELTWQYNASYHIGYTYIPNKAYGSNRGNYICSKYKVVNKSYSNMVNGETSGSQSDTGVNVKDNSTTNLDTFLSAIADARFAYPLQTPVTYQLTPQEVKTLLGSNNIWADCGTVEVSYRADTKKYINNAIASLELSMIAPIEDGTTASQAYSTGQYFLRNNVFCKAKTNIASGASFTLNTNYQETTIAAELYTALH